MSGTGSASMRVWSRNMMLMLSGAVVAALSLGMLVAGQDLVCRDQGSEMHCRSTTSADDLGLMGGVAIGAVGYTLGLVGLLWDLNRTESASP